jgi:hypothetical protein
MSRTDHATTPARSVDDATGAHGGWDFGMLFADEPMPTKLALPELQLLLETAFPLDREELLRRCRLTRTPPGRMLQSA